MKFSVLALCLLVAFFWYFLSIACAINPDSYYNPFSKKELKARVVQNNKKSNIRMALDRVKDEEDENRYIGNIYFDNKIVYQEYELEYHLSVQHRGCTFDPDKSIIADIDSNGFEDLLLPVDGNSNGMPFLSDHLLIYSQVDGGKFLKFDIPAVSFSQEDIVDFDNDGKFEFVTEILAEAYHHSYWVYRVWRLEKGRIVSVDEQFGFPRAVQFTHRSNSKTEPSKNLFEIMTGKFGYIDKIIYRMSDYQNLDNFDEIYPKDWDEIVCDRSRQGKQIQLYKNGQKIIEWERENGRPVGTWQYWNEDGTLKWRQVFNKGTFVSKMEWYPEIQPQQSAADE